MSDAGFSALLLVALAALVVRLRFRRETVFEFERALVYNKGRFRRILEPGRHWVYAPTTVLRKVDVRARFVLVPGQEVLSSDGVTLKVSLAARYRISSPAKAVNDSEDYVAALYLILQLALRELVGETPIEELLQARSQLSENLLAKTAEPAAALGLQLDSVDVRDIMFPGELKKIFAQVVQARQEGLAALERARGETAALRNLANAAKLAGDNPVLLQLRLLQQIGESRGNSIVLGFPGLGVPLPVSSLAEPETGSHDT